MKRNGWKALWGAAGLLAAGCAAGGPTNLSPNNNTPMETPRDVSKKTAPPVAQVAADANVKQLVAADTAFGLALLGELTRASPDKNVFVSPLSLTDALQMTLNGAQGKTQTAMAAGLRLPPKMTVAQVNAANELLRPSLTNPDPKVQLSLANALWARTGTAFKPDFAQRCQTSYDAQATTLDFSKPSAAKTINDWVKTNTQGKIDAIVTPDALAAAQLALTNAVYFHGTWAAPFHPEDTATAPFHPESGKPVSVPLMARTGEYAYAQNAQFQAVALPYGAGRMQMIVLLPRPGVKLDAVVKSLDAPAWTATLGALKPTRVALHLPRFRVAYDAQMTAPLTALGLGAAFAPSADFVPMGLPPGGYLSAVIHKAVMEVSEEGTVAAAATGVVAAGAAMPMPATEMRVDHPFVCAIRDSATGALLFAGAIRAPQP